MRALVHGGRRIAGAFVFLMTVAAAHSAAADTLTLRWDPSPDANVAGYVVYVGTQSGVYSASYDVGNTTAFAYGSAVPGQPYYFSVAAYSPGPVVGPRSPEVSGVTNVPPVLANPGNQSTIAGSPVSLQLVGSDPAGQPVTYGVTALPPGLALVTSTGFISGTPTTPGSYLVTAVVSDGVLSDAETFTWTITSPTQATPPPPGISTAPVVTITIPTTAASFNTNQPSVTVGGTATDDGVVTEVIWWTDRGNSGRASGTESWIAAVPLQRGSNTITIQARDDSGNVSSQELVVKSTGKK